MSTKTPPIDVSDMTHADYLWARVFAAVEGIHPNLPVTPGKRRASEIVRAYEESKRGVRR